MDPGGAIFRSSLLGASLPVPESILRISDGGGESVHYGISVQARSSRRGDSLSDSFQTEKKGKSSGAQSKKYAKKSELVEDAKDEEIFSLAGGWKVDPLTLASEEDLVNLGAMLPTNLPRQSKKQQKGGSASSIPEKVTERLTHKMLRVMAGSRGGRRLLSPSDAAVRPMMEVVRGAVFSMLQAMAGMPASLPGGRWLDLYSGTGSVGIEGLSRGCTVAHFVEADPWVVAEVLSPNLANCNFTNETVIHTARVETFLQRGEQNGAAQFGGTFDYVSVTPPYEAVVFSELMEQLGRSPFIAPETCIIVEYPLRSKEDMPEICGPLVRIRDRRYGRTHVAVYGPEWARD